MNHLSLRGAHFPDTVRQDGVRRSNPMLTGDCFAKERLAMTENKKEKTIITQDENQDTVQSQYFDPFPQPQTIPSGWDLSGLISDPQPATVTKAADSTEAGIQENK